jgi:hypothetical protein
VSERGDDELTGFWPFSEPDDQLASAPPSEAGSGWSAGERHPVRDAASGEADPGEQDTQELPVHAAPPPALPDAPQQPRAPAPPVVRDPAPVAPSPSAPAASSGPERPLTADDPAPLPSLAASLTVPPRRRSALPPPVPPARPARRRRLASGGQRVLDAGLLLLALLVLALGVYVLQLR